MCSGGKMNIILWCLQRKYISIVCREWAVTISSSLRIGKKFRIRNVMILRIDLVLGDEQKNFSFLSFETMFNV